jgi:hypothetical protein
MRNFDACLYFRRSDRTTLARLVADAAENRCTGPHCAAVGSRVGHEQHPARGAGIEADSLALAEGLRGRRRRAPAQGQRKGAARGQEAYQCRSAARNRDADSPGEAQARNALERADVGRRARRRPTTVQRVWKEHGLKPHLSRSFKLSNDPKFAEKVVDIVGLYLDPPDKAVASTRKARFRRSIARNRACR